MRAAAVTLRAVPRLALRLPRRARRFGLIALIAAVALSAVYYGWFRDSSLVQVRDVSVTGLTGPDAEKLRERLTEAGLRMTTLHVRDDDLRRAVESEPSIRAIRATPDFPHGLRIDVIENQAVAAVAIPGNGRVPIAGNGILMPGLETKAGVPEIRAHGDVRVGRRGDGAARIADERVAALVRVAAAAPQALLARATTIEKRPGEGIVVVMRDGPRLMFGDDARIADKWRAAAGVLASRHTQGAAYVDVRLPDRPVAGGLGSQPPAAGAAGAAIDPVAPATQPGAPASPEPITVPAAGAVPAAPSTVAGGSPTGAAAPGTATPAPAALPPAENTP